MSMRDDGEGASGDRGGRRPCSPGIAVVKLVSLLVRKCKPVQASEKSGTNTLQRHSSNIYQVFA